MRGEPESLQVGLENREFYTKLSTIKDPIKRLSNNELAILDKNVLTYLRRKCNNRGKRKTQPLEIRILFISNRLKYSYKQIRNSIYRLEKSKLIERWLVWSEPKVRKVYIRIPQ